MTLLGWVAPRRAAGAAAGSGNRAHPAEAEAVTSGWLVG